MVPPADDIALAPATVELPEYIAYFMSQLPRDLVAWVLNNEAEVPTQIRRLGGDLYLMGMSSEEREACAERFMLCVELAKQFSLHRRGAFDDEARTTFALLSMTLAERAWLASSPTQHASQMRELHKQIAASSVPDEKVLDQYADAVRIARSLNMFDLGATFRFAVGRTPSRSP